MKILHILEDYSLNSGGLRTVVKSLNDKLLKGRNNSFIISTKKEKEDKIYGLIPSNLPWLYSNSWKRTLCKIHKEEGIQIIHIHGVWMYPQYVAAKFAIQKNIPFIVSPHGMYEPWLWSQGTEKKKIYFNLFSKPLFSKAKVIHSITKPEFENIEKLFKKTQIVEIPNLIDIPDIDFKKTKSSSEKYILYVGRLDQKKGVDILIQAFGKLNPKEFRLKIAGGFNDYKIELEKLVKSLNIENKVDFLGMITGKDKIEIFKNAFTFVAPSHSEVVGMVNLEAAILKTPVITTYQTGLDKRWNEEGGMIINPNKDELFDALKDVLAWTTETRNANGERLYNFVLENYSWKAKFKDWEATYKSMISLD